jgi:dihydrofolate reductase
VGALISLIAAIGNNHELGAANDLLWHLPDDFAWFIRHTKGHPVIMGRKTMEALGKPLRNRRNMVVTRNQELLNEGFEFYPNLEAALSSAAETEKEEIFVIGGGQIYTQSLPLADRLYITEVHGHFSDADTFFPKYGEHWIEVFSDLHTADEKHKHSFEFKIFEKQKV